MLCAASAQVVAQAVDYPYPAERDLQLLNDPDVNGYSSEGSNVR